MNTDRHLPQPARQLVNALVNAGWQLRVTWSTQGGHLHVTIEGGDPVTPQRHVRVTWHTRATGTLRLSSCLVGTGVKCRHSTLKQAMAYISEES